MYIYVHTTTCPYTYMLTDRNKDDSTFQNNYAHTYIDIDTHVSMDIELGIARRKQIRIDTCLYIYTYLNIFRYACLYMRINTHLHTTTNTFPITNTYTQTYTCVHEHLQAFTHIVACAYTRE